MQTRGEGTTTKTTTTTTVRRDLGAETRGKSAETSGKGEEETRENGEALGRTKRGERKVEVGSREGETDDTDDREGKECNARRRRGGGK